jgi:hypothetical protein
MVANFCLLACEVMLSEGSVWLYISSPDNSFKYIKIHWFITWWWTILKIVSVLGLPRALLQMSESQTFSATSHMKYGHSHCVVYMNAIKSYSLLCWPWKLTAIRVLFPMMSSVPSSKVSQCQWNTGDPLAVHDVPWKREGSHCGLLIEYWTWIILLSPSHRNILEDGGKEKFCLQIPVILFIICYSWNAFISIWKKE